MAKPTPSTGAGQADLLAVKQATLTALMADDNLVDRLVLKGGSALEMIHGVSTRASIDLDFSMSGTFAPEELDPLRNRLEWLLARSLAEAGFHVMDVKLRPQPGKLSADIADFWGGHELTFKVVTQRVADAHPDPEQRRRRAVAVGAGGRAGFSVDISSHEYVEPKTEREVDGYTVFVYSVEMIVAEKLRALCQQMPAYAPVVKRAGRPGAPRARDFLDIHAVVTGRGVDMATVENLRLLRATFDAKKVPLDLLAEIGSTADFHRTSWPSVRDTVHPDFPLEPFEVYFGFVAKLVDRLLAAGLAGDTGR